MTKRIRWDYNEKVLVVNEFVRLDGLTNSADETWKTLTVEAKWERAQQVLPKDRQRKIVTSALYKLDQYRVNGIPKDQKKDVVPKSKVSKPVPKPDLRLVVDEAKPEHEPKTKSEVQVSDKPKTAVKETMQVSSFESSLRTLIQEVVSLELAKFEKRLLKLVVKPDITEIKQLLEKVIEPVLPVVVPVVPETLTTGEKSTWAVASKTPPRENKKKVFVCGGTNALFASIVDRMPNVEFHHGDGHNPRSITGAKTYDLVIATKFTGHPTMHKLRDQYSDKFRFVKKGGVSEVTSTIREFFSKQS